MAIKKQVICSHFPFLPIQLEVHSRKIKTEALLDTGFDGDVVIPLSLIANGHNASGHHRWILADGSRIIAPYYVGKIRIDTFGPFPVVITTLGNEPLVGIGVAKHFTIILNHGKQLIIEP